LNRMSSVSVVGPAFLLRMTLAMSISFIYLSI
jgi:hypothetical protein